MKINLEKELIRQNKKIAAPSELLLIKEYDRLGDDIADNDVLSAIGLNKAVRAGRDTKIMVTGSMKATERFNQDRVFHISQIAALCKKYHLRFLPTEYYKGSIDPALPIKITQVEVAYDIKFNMSNCRIAAPAASFRLEERPKDPLLFYKINDDYYYLVYKWGNDLSVLRRLMPLLSKSWFCRIMVTLIGVIIGLTLFVTIGHPQGRVIGLLIPAAVGALANIPMWIDEVTFVKENDWLSEYR